MDPFVGQIIIVPFNFAPRGWAFCNGQLMPISQNTALFSLLGIQYGGDGTSTFALPNLQGSAPMHWGNGAGLTPRDIGETGGESAVTLLQSQMPVHNHLARCNSAAGAPGQASPAGNVWAPAPGRTPPHVYSSVAPNSQLNAAALSLVGGNGSHNNMSPFLGMSFIIALQGVFPPRN